MYKTVKEENSSCNNDDSRTEEKNDWNSDMRYRENLVLCGLRNVVQSTDTQHSEQNKILLLLLLLLLLLPPPLPLLPPPPPTLLLLLLLLLRLIIIIIKELKQKYSARGR